MFAGKYLINPLRTACPITDVVSFPSNEGNYGEHWRVMSYYSVQNGLRTCYSLPDTHTLGA